MIRLNINGRELTGQEGQTILDICLENGISVPTLCHDERVKMYGACGICVVEAEGSPKLLRSCSTLAADGMIIRTNSEKIAETRRTALELLLSDHRGDCRPPCVQACPGRTDCQGYVGLIANGEYREAVEVIKDKLPLPACIGRVCPHPCETACRRKLVEEPVSIAALKYYAADIDLDSENPFLPKLEQETGKTAAIIGGGPGGLSSAYFLRRKGVAVDIFDAMPKMGGMLRYGIPEYRLPKNVVDEEVAVIEKMGVKMHNNVKIGRDISLEHLRDKYDAVVLAVGAWKSAGLGCPGEELEGVIGGIDFLREVALNQMNYSGRRIAVVGGGNTAMDACRTALRLGADKVYNVYRRTKAEMPAEQIEISEAEEEGVIFKNLTNPAEIIEQNGRVSEVRLQVMELGEPDASGRRSPVPIKDKFETIEVDTVVVAIGQQLDADGLESVTLNRRGNIEAGEGTFQTNLPGVFAIGDATNKGAGIAIEAIGEARFSSDVIISYLNGSLKEYSEPFIVEQEFSEKDFEDRERIARVKMRHIKPDDRNDNFREINCGYSEEEAVNEAKRCLECGCHDYFECKLIDYANTYTVKPEKYESFNHNREALADNSHRFIKRNPDKCILCGLCVRVCDELIGSTALGFVGRGFDTMVRPALDRPLDETDCISCGQCITLCPTGALQEVTAFKKPVPVREDITRTSCGFCGAGCGVSLTSIGDTLLRCLPDNTEDKTAILCSKGRFGTVNNLLGLKRIVNPTIIKDGGAREVSFREAYIHINKKVQGLINKFGSDAVRVAVSDKLTNEEIYLINRYSAEVLGIGQAFSFGAVKSGLEAVLGRDGSTVTQAELENTEFVLVFEKDLHESHTVPAIRLRNAAASGKRMFTVSSGPTKLSEAAELSVFSGKDTDFLKQLVKALLDLGCRPKNVTGLSDLIDYVSDVVPGEEAVKTAEAYLKAKSAVIVFEADAYTYDATLLIAAIAVLGGHVGRARSGIAALKRNCNSQGLYNMGVSTDSEKHINDLIKGGVKGLLIFGEDPVGVNLSGLEFLMVADTFESETTGKADVLLPLAGFAESEGSFTNSFRAVNHVGRAVNPPFGLCNMQLILGLANISQDNFDFSDPGEIFEEIKRKIPGYNSDPVSIGSGYVPYATGFMTESGVAKLLAPQGRRLYTQNANPNILYRRFEEIMK